MATGDISGNIQRLVDHLHRISYPVPVSARRLREGDPSVLLPILHYAVLDFSRHVAVACSEYHLFGRSDSEFAYLLFKLAQHWGVKTPLTSHTFMARGFVERKLLFVTDVIKAAVSIHEERERAALLAEKVIPPYSRTHDLSSPTAQGQRIVGSEVYEEAPLPSASSQAALLPPTGYPYEHTAATGAIRSSGALPTLPSAPLETQLIWDFLKDAVAIGSGASTSLAAKKSQILLESQVSLPTLATALDATTHKHTAPSSTASLKSDLRRSTDLGTDIMRLSTEFMRGFPSAAQPETLQYSCSDRNVTGGAQKGVTESKDDALFVNRVSAPSTQPSGSSPATTPSRLPVHKRHMQHDSSTSHAPKPLGTVIHAHSLHDEQRRMHELKETELRGNSSLVHADTNDDSTTDTTAAAAPSASSEVGRAAVLAMTVAREMEKATSVIMSKLTSMEGRLMQLEERTQHAISAHQEDGDDSRSTPYQPVPFQWHSPAAVALERQIEQTAALQRAEAMHYSLKEATKQKVAAAFQGVTPHRHQHQQQQQHPIDDVVLPGINVGAEVEASAPPLSASSSTPGPVPYDGSEYHGNSSGSNSYYHLNKGSGDEVNTFLQELLQRGKQTEALVARARAQLHHI